MKRLCVYQPPKWEKGIAWPSFEGEPMVFVDQVRFPTPQSQRLAPIPESELYVFGARRPLETRFGHGYRIHLTVVEHRIADDRVIEHALAQHEGVAWTTPTDQDEELSVDMMDPSDFRYVTAPPRWKASEASWPTYAGEPMIFVRQWYLRESSLTKKHLTWDAMLFLFAYPAETTALNIKMWMQSVSGQTAEDHYRAEEIMWRFAANPSDQEVVLNCVLEGDRFVHQFILDHPSLSVQTIEILVKHGKTPEIRRDARNLIKARNT